MAKQNKGTALVTGGAIRVGKAIAIALAKDGYDIALHYNSSKKEAEKTAAEIRKLGKRCEIFKADLNKPKSLKPLVDSVFKKFGDTCLLINNASIFERASLKETDEDIFDRHMNINFKAPFFLTRYFADKCKKGLVVNILDTYITRNTNAYFIYLITKKALAEFTKMAALGLGPDIRVNGICPGTLLPSKGFSQKDIEKKAEKMPLGRISTLEDITKTVIFLAESKYITGELIFIDSGHKLT